MTEPTLSQATEAQLLAEIAKRIPDVVITPPPTTQPPPTTTPPTTPPTTPTPAPGPLIFNGDYSTGDFSQWSVLQCRGYNSAARGYPATGNYQAQILTDPAVGKAARYEVRAGDVPNFGGGERSEVQGGTIAREGDMQWYSWWTKFDPTFSSGHSVWPNWCLVNQWHSNGNGIDPISFYANGNSYSFNTCRQSAPQQFMDSGNNVIRLDMPMDRGKWHRIVMQVKWSASDSIGFVRVWRDGVAQIFKTGGTTWTGRTWIPGDSGVYYKEGIYRAAISATDVIYHAGFNVAATQAALG